MPENKRVPKPVPPPDRHDEGEFKRGGRTPAGSPPPPPRSHDEPPPPPPRPPKKENK